jgi:hypothetical protein
MGRFRSGRARVALVLSLFLLVVACKPAFPAGSRLLARSAGGTGVRLIWAPATDNQAGHAMWYYAIEVDGTLVANVPAPSTSCTLTGLASGKTYTLSVTAWSWTGTAGEWSGDLDPADGRRSTTYTTPTGTNPGGAVACGSDADSDGDRLPNWAENNNGVFVNASRTGTNPNVADTDGDGLFDGDETLGTLGGLYLPGMGTNPLKKNLLLEFDWFEDSLNCGPHSHRPPAAAITSFENAFANASVPNPDGTTGIDVISDYGQGGAFKGGNLVTDPDGNIIVTFEASGFGGAEFLNYKAANFASNRNGYFHYVLMPHSYNSSGSSGVAELPGDDFLVSLAPWPSLGCVPNPSSVANTIMHELGHNLNLRHGGFSNTNYKPNYNSVMNYKYQFPGVDTNCTPPGDGKLDYSYGTRIALNETNLNELAGTCGTVPWDWNGNGTHQSGVIADINVDELGIGDQIFNTLTDYNDWANLLFGGLTDIDGASERVEVVVEQAEPRPDGG